ncbi:MAG TPA: WXG100 family type VII secretion target, partial [Herpetosiphonaceae bacterium]
MAADVVQADYEALEAIAQRLGQAADTTAQMKAQVRQSCERIIPEGWVGDAADAFDAEMRGTVFPAVERLEQLWGEAQAATKQISALLRAAEDEASAVFNDWRLDGAVPVG